LKFENLKEKNHMRKLFALLVTISICLLFYFPTSVFTTTPENIEAGDLFIYNVSKWDVPYEALIPPEEQPPFNLSELVLDLSGSTLGIKVMDTYSNGYYLLDLFVISGNSVSIPLPPQNATLAPTPTPAEAYQIFGDSIDIPAGVGFSIGSIPGSDFLETLAGIEEDPGVPFYLNPAEWNKYEAEIGAAIEEKAPGTAGITNQEGSDFEIHLTGTEDNVTINLIIKWFREGDNAGVFKSISGTIDGDINNDTIDDYLEVSVEYESKDNNPLPEFIQDRGELTLTMTKADFEFSREGSLFDDPAVSEQLLLIEDMILDLEDREVLKYDIKSTRGCYYQTTQSQYDPNTGTLSPMEGSTWWNGFTGFRTVQNAESFGSNYNMTAGIIPTGAPGMTPDWDMWRASTTTVQEFLKVLEKQVELWSGTTNFTDLGLTLDEFDTNYEMRYSGDIVFFYGNITLDAGFNAADIPEEYEPPEESILNILGPYLKNTTAIEVQAFGKFWISYTQKAGILAGAGALVNASLAITDFPIGPGPEEGGLMYGTGSLDINADLEVQSDKVNKLPDPEEAGTEPEEGDGLFTPGFTIIPALMVIAAVVVFIRKRR
jgi:hypothetical protein